MDIPSTASALCWHTLSFRVPDVVATFTLTPTKTGPSRKGSLGTSPSGMGPFIMIRDNQMGGVDKVSTELFILLKTVFNELGNKTLFNGKIKHIKHTFCEGESLV